jgi:hypothetical protein
MNATNKYCNCYDENFGEYGPEKTGQKCDSILIGKYHLYRLYCQRIHSSGFTEIRPSLQDSLRRFMSVFRVQINKTCPGYFYSSTYSDSLYNDVIR